MNALLKKALAVFKKEDVVPSDQQFNVLDWVVNGKGSLQLLARAGCGKTFTLMLVVRLIVMGRLGDVALMAYNRKIAHELKEKIGPNGLNINWQDALAGTVHSFGLKAWTKVAPNVDVDDDKIWKILKVMQAEAMNRRVDEAVFIESISGAIAKMVDLGKQRAVGVLTPINNDEEWFYIWDHFGIEDDVTENVTFEQVLPYVKKVYKTSLDQCRQVIDFNDMILAPLYFKARFWKRKWVLVDESQDTNPARRALAFAMLAPGGRMIFVGDDCQAIYGFTGADSDAMEILKRETNAITLPLNVTRRCPKLVVEEARKLVPDFQAHPDAPEGVLRNLDYNNLEHEGLSYNDAILCRNTAPLVQTAYMLIGKGIACRVEGREIGDGLIKLARRWKLKTLDKLITRLEEYEEKQIAKFKEKEQLDRIDKLVDQISCLRVIIDRCLIKKLSTIDELVDEVKSMFGDTPEGQQPKVLVLSTAHKSKGREWKRVYLLGREKYMPSPYAKKDWQMVQEKNLEYVALTRAMSELIFVPAVAEVVQPAAKVA